MVYKANRKLFLKKNAKTAVWMLLGYVLSFVFTALIGGVNNLELVVWGLQMVTPFCIFGDFFWRKDSVILPSFTILDGRISTAKFYELGFEEIDLEKSEISREKIELVNKFASWKNKVTIDPDYFEVDVLALINDNISRSSGLVTLN